MNPRILDDSVKYPGRTASRFYGICKQCGEAYRVGDNVNWNPRVKGTACHASCYAVYGAPSGAEFVPTPVVRQEPPTLQELNPDQIHGMLNAGQKASVINWLVSANSKINAIKFVRDCVSSASLGSCKNYVESSYCVASEATPNFVSPNPKPSNTLGEQLAEAVAPYLNDRLRGLVTEGQVQRIIENILEGKVFKSVVTVEYQEESGFTRDCGIQHKQFPTLLKTMQARTADGFRLNVWLVGPAGTGKTTAAKNCSEALGLPFYFTGSIDTEYKLLGFVDAQGRITSTAFRTAYTEGGVFLFDECDSSLPPALLAFNAALANGECAFPDGVLQRHKDFICIAAANTWGLGATNDYVGRLKLDGAFLDRFVQMTWGIDESLEQVTVGNDVWVSKVQTWRKRAKEKGIKVIISPRASYFGASLLAVGMDQEMVEAMTVRKAMSDEQWNSLQREW